MLGTPTMLSFRDLIPISRRVSPHFPHGSSPSGGDLPTHPVTPLSSLLLNRESSTFFSLSFMIIIYSIHV